MTLKPLAANNFSNDSNIISPIQNTPQAPTSYFDLFKLIFTVARHNMTLAAEFIPFVFACLLATQKVCAMAKYQFFELSKDNNKLVRYLCTDRKDFLPAKEMLLRQGFEVIGDMIYAKDDKEAIAHFNSGMIYPLAEYNKAQPMGGIFYFVKGLFEELRDFIRRRAKN